MSVKIVHCADIHIGFSGGDRRYGSRRRAEVIEAFLTAVDFAKKNQADLLLIAGDLFDSHKVSEDTANQVFSALSSFSGRVFIATGNHDYYTENSLWNNENISENTYIFKGDEAVTVEELGVRVYGNAFNTAYRNTPVLLNAASGSDYINIGVIHGDLAADSSYCPINESIIKNSNMDYIALGHIHKRSEIQKAGNTFYAYCGCIEGQGFDETGEKGIYFGTVDKGRAEMEFVPLCMRQFIEENIDISEVSGKAELPEFILHKISEKYGEQSSKWLYKIVLTGESGLTFSAAEIETALERELYFAKVKDKTKAPVGDLKLMAEENSVKGIFVRKFLERMKENPSEETETALRLGLRALYEEVALDED